MSNKVNVQGMAIAAQREAMMQEAARREFIEGNGLEVTRAVFVQLAADECRSIVARDKAARQVVETSGEKYETPDYELDLDLQVSLSRLVGKAFLYGMGMLRKKEQPVEQAAEAPAEEKPSPILVP